jgi:hypothetical protein
VSPPFPQTIRTTLLSWMKMTIANGSIWLLWDYMVLKGLQNYGYNEIARQPADKLMLAVSIQLLKYHHFGNLTVQISPVQESPSNHFWGSVLAKILIDVYNKE